MSAETLCSASAILRGTEPVSALPGQHIWASVCQDPSSSSSKQWNLDGHVKIYNSVSARLPLTKSKRKKNYREHSNIKSARVTWAEIIAILEPLSWLTARSVASCFPDFSKIQKKRRPSKRLFYSSCPWLCEAHCCWSRLIAFADNPVNLSCEWEKMAVQIYISQRNHLRNVPWPCSPNNGDAGWDEASINQNWNLHHPKENQLE